jgi:hypothetical protein
LIFKENFSVPSLDEQVDGLFEMYKSNESWLKVQEARGNRSFLDNNGLVDDNALREYLKRKVELARGSIGAQGKEIATDVKIQRKPLQVEDHQVVEVQAAERVHNRKEIEMR